MNRQQSRIALLPVGSYNVKTFEFGGLRPEYQDQVHIALEEAFREQKIDVLQNSETINYFSHNFLMLWHNYSENGSNVYKIGENIKMQPIFNKCRYCPHIKSNDLTWRRLTEHLKQQHGLLPHEYFEAGMQGLLACPESIIYGNLTHDDYTTLYEIALIKTAIFNKQFNTLCFYWVNKDGKIEVVLDYLPKMATRHECTTVLDNPFNFRLECVDIIGLQCEYRKDWYLGYLPLVQRRIVKEQFPLFYQSIENYVTEDLIPDLFLYCCELYHKCVQLFNKK